MLLSLVIAFSCRRWQVNIRVIGIAHLSQNPPNGVERALEQGITGMERGPTRRIWDVRGQ